MNTNLNWRILLLGLLLAFCGWTTSAARAAAAEGDIRVLFDFESADDIKAIAAESTNSTFDLSQDEGVTSGKQCCRATFKKGGDYSEIYFSGDKKQGWEAYDYFAMDLYVRGEDRTGIALEFWDAASTNYPTRCTIDTQVVPGKQTVLIPINRAKRNNKEGSSWDELEPKDKINMAALAKAKIHFQTPKDHDLVWMIDNVRLLKENALGRKITVELPAGAKAFCLGKAIETTGFAIVPSSAGFDGTKGFSVKADLQDVGKRWPDPLTGTGVYSPTGQPFTFDLALPDGEYFVWLAAGQVLQPEIKNPHFLLKVANQTIIDTKPSLNELYSDKYMFRFMNTPYSQRENSQWLDFIDRMYPTHETKVNVTGGKLSIQACNYELSSLIVLPAKDPAAFAKLTAAIKAERIRIFYAQQLPFTPKGPARQAGDGAFVAFIPDEQTQVTPNTGPTKAEREHKQYDLVAAPTQNLIFRVAISSFEDLGKASLTISDLKGPASIPASAARLYYQDFRLRGVDIVETGLIPSNQVALEKNLTRCFWVWLRLPADIATGTYSGTVTLTAGAGGTDNHTFPLQLKVLPIKLEQTLPYAFGMWYGARQMPDPARQKQLISEQLQFMREIGFTGVDLPGPDGNGNVDPTLYNLAKAAGMGKHPMQMSMSGTLGMGRSIARSRLGYGPKIDRNPGSEFQSPEFKGLFMEGARKFNTFLKTCGLPMAIQTVDEPREVPNPWNRNLEETNRYGDYLKEAGIPNSFVTPMGDNNGGKDYTSLVDHHDIISTHAGKGSEILMRQSIEKKKILWLYNTGMDRLSWGFYNWRVGSVGRWEWHFCDASGGSEVGYVNENEWYNPFTNCVGATSYAPMSFKGALIFSTRFFGSAEGITDTAYLVTLQNKMQAAKADPAKAATVAKAQALLDEIKAAVPFLPEVAGIASEADGALVGQGLKTPAAQRCETWRRQIGSILIEFGN